MTVTLIDDFDGEAPADETVEFGLDGVTYEIDLSSKNAAKLRNDLKQWVEAAAGSGGAGRASAGRGRGTIDRSKAPRSGNGPVATGATCPLVAVSRPTSSKPSTPPTDSDHRAQPDGWAPVCFSLVAN
ncbi:protein lsr2 [Mycobacterium xenopi 3993]|nr:protein lsr2 [Mycobacterium xenopi 3993]